MVYTKHINVRSLKHMKVSVSYSENAAKTTQKVSEENHFDAIFPYIINADKTIEQRLVSGYKISDVFHADDEFLWTKQIAAMSKGNKNNLKNYDDLVTFDRKSLENNNATLAHHLIQSFSPDDNLTPEEIHEIGRKTVLELTGGNHEFIIATHVDKEHIHNHIIFNSTNMVTGNAFRWQKGTKRVFEQISDKHASLAGAKIIQKSPKTSHKKYTTWQTENIFQKKIKQRLDFLIAHSSTIEDFKLKAEALNLSVDFTGKWTTYKLLDQPQIKNTRSRSLSKKDPERYNLKRIEDQLKKNKLKLSVEEVVDRYVEKEDESKQDFDYEVTIEPWQVHHSTTKGYYLNVDFGVANHGQLFIGAYKVDELENGNLKLYLKKNDFFYFMNEKDSDRSRYMDGQTLTRQLSLYNGTVPIKKEPVISTLNQIVDAINFLAEHHVTDGSQLEHLEKQLMKAMDDAQVKLDGIDQAILSLSEVSKYLVALNSDDTEEVEVAQKALEKLKVNKELTYEDIAQELASEKLSRKVLKTKLDETIEDFNTYNGIKKAGQKTTKEEQVKNKMI